MPGVNAWGRMHTPAKQSQFTLDMFEEWKAKQNEDIAQRGADRDPAVEEEHNRYMLRQNLNAYVCYKELDRYTTCLEDKKLIRRRDDEDGARGGGTGVSMASSFEINTRNKVNEKLCRATHNAYVSCMSSQKNQEVVLQSASLEPHCTEGRAKLFHCLRENQVSEAQTNTPQCTDTYRSLLRCGLNHLWNHYWREITKFSDTDEFHLYELSRDDNKKQAYLRALTTSEAQQQSHLREARDIMLGYYLDPKASQKGNS
ncbi:hypothetical protein conserved [Leishmania donovani]|uniref:Uncharacterized protein n=3 Tax=Leishmania donovani species complex TaxID=38574 RepID=A4HUY8_LEIIN|nr:conserved hypothetical protein [Leishmania infantum JPCM5]XP_003859055.1 hypothetical protein, conserved [Leishmania donovani]CAC9460898.1 hypothetical_protein_-_conserved [Leishmania infantum]AYU76847.1 hypothetical protein LdCL_110013300 [Leishmania donovani]TPP39860.1 hypothetical protein CGC20_30945 [Leishmania donovani]TPP53020.1 hypothetical protein CGC21_0860 [Leishmania donovani]CAJ1986906.1 hypothetical protein conserved [Leishmania donovani]|eukprot:XP_001463879.1 conserved hypothetical protein [Leishmania infantum JPCM5]